MSIYRTAPPIPQSKTLAEALPWWPRWMRRIWWFFIGYGRSLERRDDRAHLALQEQYLRNKLDGTCWSCGNAREHPAYRTMLCDSCHCLWQEGHLLLGKRRIIGLVRPPTPPKPGTGRDVKM